MNASKRIRILNYLCLEKAFDEISFLYYLNLSFVTR